VWDGKTPGLWFGGAAFLLLAAAWPRVIVDRGGLTVVNVLPHRVAWEDIAAVQWRHRWDRTGLFLVLADGRKLWAWGVLTDGYGDGAEWTEAAYRDLEARWRAASDRSA
jgi:hypothetical protein